MDKKTEHEDEMSKDMAKEKEFLALAKKKNVYELNNELSLLVKTYNEQLEQLVKIRVDLEAIDYLVIAEPSNNEHAQRRANTKQALSQRRRLLRVIREHIERHLKEKKEEEDGKKD